MATLNLSVTQQANFEFVFNVQLTGLTETYVELYASISGGDWEYLFMIPLDQSGSGVQSWTLGGHLVGERVAFWAGLPGVIASNQVTLTVNGNGNGPTKDGFCLLTALGLPEIVLRLIRELLRPILPGLIVRKYYGLSARILS